MNYLIFNRTNGQIAHLGLEGVLHMTTGGAKLVSGVMDDATYAALQKLKAGEYVHVGVYVVVGSAGGVTLDELKQR